MSTNNQNDDSSEEYDVKDDSSEESSDEEDSRDYMPDELTLENIKSVEKIGSFSADKIGIGDTDYVKIKLRSGMYNAYQVDDNLMIINKDLNIKPTKKNITEWTWKYSKLGVGVDTGMFGFYNIKTVEKINKLLSEDEYNLLPLIDCKGTTGEIVTGLLVEDLKKEDKKKFNAFGVIASTGTGDGGFECYTIDDDKAILLGGYTMNKIANYEDE